MEAQRYKEMLENFDEINQNGILEHKKIFIFGHCHASEKLVDLLLERGFTVAAILDNNTEKHGNNYRGIIIMAPQEIMNENPKDVIVCIVARAYAAMVSQLESLGYRGTVHKLVDYNSYAEYSLAEETISRMSTRRKRGSELFLELKQRYPDRFRFLCPFSALGDIYIMMSYLPHYMKKHAIEKCVVGVVGNACAQVACLFDFCPVEVFSQKDMDETIQAALYEQDEYTFIPHQDRPYVVNLHKALYLKCIPLEQIYCCGVFGLPTNIKPIAPTQWKAYADLQEISEGNAVIFSPYAKSVPTFSEKFWQDIVSDFHEKGYQCFTNVAGDEKPLDGTEGISPQIAELKSVVERAGTFIGIRSGLCDVIKDALCDKIALYPDYNYSDTKWKAVDIYAIDGWKNIVVDEGFVWNRS